jgi:hypothetical protein
MFIFYENNLLIFILIIYFIKIYYLFNPIKISAHKYAAVKVISFLNSTLNNERKN